jgi:putative transposase
VSAFIDEHREDFGVEPICRTLDVSASAYYQRKTGKWSARQLSDERVLAEIRRVHKANYECYGSRRVWKQLLREGIIVARCTVERLMAAHAIQGAKRRGKPWRTTRPDPDARPVADLVERDFTAQAPNRLWVADFTYLRTWAGALYFAFIIDVFSRMIVGWQLACHMRDDLVLDALRMALGLRSPGADVVLVHHSDRGSQYTSTDYTQTLDDHDVLASLGSTGDCFDNALAESFVDSFKTELIADCVWRTHEQAELAILEWVGWYNHDRLHSSLDDIPPAEYEQLHAATSTLIPGNGSVAAALPKAANGLRTRLLLPPGVIESQNDPDPRRASSTPALAAKFAAPNGSGSTATVAPPMDMLTTIRVANIPTGAATTNDRPA